VTEEKSHYFGPDPQNKKQQCYQFRNSSASSADSSSSANDQMHNACSTQKI